MISKPEPHIWIIIFGLPDILIDCEGNAHDVPCKAQLRFEIKPEALVEVQSWMRNLGLPPTQDARQHQDYNIF